MSKLKFKSFADSKVRSRKNHLKEKLLRKSLKWLFMVLRKHPIHIYQKVLSKSGLFSYLGFFRGYYIWCFSYSQTLVQNYCPHTQNNLQHLRMSVLNSYNWLLTCFGQGPLFFWFDFFLEARAEIQKYFRSFFGAMKTLKFDFEIYWPLILN